MSDSALMRRHQIYVAFAFAAADVLLELDAEGRITFAIGAAKTLTGYPARLLTGRHLPDIMEPSERDRLAHVLDRMHGGERVRNTQFKLRRPEGSSTTIVLSGYRAPDADRNLLVVIGHSACNCQFVERRHPHSGLLDKDGFQAVAGHLLQGTGKKPPCTLTLLDVPEIEDVRRETGAEAAEALVAIVGEYLRDNSLRWDSAGQLSDTTYGVVHGPAITESEIASTVAGMVRQAAPSLPPTVPRSWSLRLDVADSPPEETALALAHVVNTFIADTRSGTCRDTLAAGLQPRLSATIQRMKATRRLIEREEFDLVFQPVVDLWTDTVHHFECLVRLRLHDSSPFETITFAEDVGLVGKLDVAVCRRVIDLMRDEMGANPALRFAVNLSGRTLCSKGPLAELRAMLRQAEDLRDRLLFEITESAAIDDLQAANAVIQDIRGQGFSISLDDFGAGAAALHYLRELKVDNVKIDGIYVRDMLKGDRSASFVKAIVQLCGDLGVSTTAEFVESAEAANLLKLVKVRYGQGWYFGKPFTPSPSRDARLSWVTHTTRWRNGLLFFHHSARPQPA